MKFRKLGRATLAAVLSLGVAAVLGACGATGTNDTVDYVYVTNTKNTPGQINVYDADGDSGALHQIPDSPYPSGGSNPVALVTSPNFKYLYVVNNGQGGSAGSGIVEFGIGTDAKLYAQHTYQGPAGSSLSLPNGVAINTAGTLLFVTYTFILGNGSTSNPSSGALVVYPINSDGSLGTPVVNGSLPYYPLSTGTDILNPIAVNVLTQNPGNSTTAGGTFVYVVSQNSTTALGSISAFSVASSGALTYLPCSSSTATCDASGNGTYIAGASPNAIASTPLGLYLFVTDSARNQLLSYTVQSSGQIIATPASPTNTDVFPDSVTVEPHGEYVYVANYAANNVGAYAIKLATNSSPFALVPVSTYGTGTGPTCVFVEPALGSYVYTTNFLDNTVSGLNLNLGTGALAPVQDTPFIAAGQPTCIAATPHKNHPPITSAD